MKQRFLLLLGTLSVVFLLTSCMTNVQMPVRATPLTSGTTSTFPTNFPTKVTPTQTETQTPAQLVNGPVVGAVTSNSARVFIQTNQVAKVQLLYGKDDRLGNATTSKTVQTKVDSGLADQIELRDLEPDTRYFINVLVDGRPQFLTSYPSFKSFPASGQDIDFSFAVLTDFFWMPSLTFQSVATEEPDFVIIGGDFSHTNPTTLEQKRQLFMSRYDRNGKVPDFVHFILDRFALAHFWDDHDFGKNNADKTYPNKELSLRVLRDFFPVYPLGESGDWQRFSYGNADFFLLDARSQRDPSKDPDTSSKSLLDGDSLGTAGQFHWLTDGLLNSQAKWKFILTPVPFNPTVEKEDSWAGYLTERKALVDFVQTNKITGIIFISGDLHAGAIDDGTNSTFPEMLVPSPNGKSCLTAVKPGKWSVGVYAAPEGDGCTGYGLVRIMTEPDRVELSIKRENGAKIFSLSIRR